jgi:hypothetical protein
MATNWIDDILPFRRLEYAKPEFLLTDLLWRSPGSSLAADVLGKPLIKHLSDLKMTGDPPRLTEPNRLVPRQLRGGNPKTVATQPLAEGLDLTGRVVVPEEATGPVRALLTSLAAPQTRGDKSKSIACVPVHPAVVALQTLHGLVNKPDPPELADAIETMGWLGGALQEGAVARSLLTLFGSASNPRDGTTGAVEWLLPQIAAHAWSCLPAQFDKPTTGWPVWPTVCASPAVTRPESPVKEFRRTPFFWFWSKWKTLNDPENNWHERLPARRFTDWALCLLRTGLAFSYLWEAEFFCRLHEMVVRRISPASVPTANRVRSLFHEGAVLATIEPPAIPASQKSIWPATADLIARGRKARIQINDSLSDSDSDSQRLPPGAFLDAIDQWIAGLTVEELQTAGVRLRVTASTANNQKEFVKYLLLPRSSDDDSMDQADFYALAQTNGRHTWFRPGPEWLVVITSLLCHRPGGQCTLGELNDDLMSLGVRAERSVLVGLLEEAGLSSDSPDADDALVIRSGF